MECPSAALERSPGRIRHDNERKGKMNAMDQEAGGRDLHSTEMSGVSAPPLVLNVQVYSHHGHRHTFHSFVHSFSNCLLCSYDRLCSLGAADTAVNKPPRLNKMPDISAMKKVKLSHVAE